MTGRRPALVALVVAVALVAVACDRGDDVEGRTGTTGGATVSPSSVPSVRESPSPESDEPGSAAEARAALCDYGPPPASEPVPPEGPTPEAIADVEDAVEDVRGLSFTEPVVADAVSRSELVDGLEESFDYSFPRELFERRSLAWQTIGVVPKGTSIRDELEAFLSGQVIGYYDTLTGELVFIGTDEPSAYERVTLAHELTHAVDDQHFGLERIDSLLASCRDEAAAAAVALVEGSATFFMTAYALRYLTLEEQLSLGQEGGDTPQGIDPFIERQQIWPYVQGQSFVTALSVRGGTEAIDAAFLDLPLSTEQILHPERYPNDLPTPVDVPDLAPALGAAWGDLDVQDIGEAWLSLALGLRLQSGDAEEAAAGWDGGVYRAWTDGKDVAVVLATTWDTPEDAEAFAEAMGEWIAASPDAQVAEVVPVAGSDVRVLFASDAATLTTLRAAALGSGT